MEIYFDKKTRKLLRYIKWHPKKTFNHIQQKFTDKGIGMLLINMCMDDYLICTRSDGTHTNFKNDSPWHSVGDDVFWVTPKGNKLLEDRFDRLWQWSIPTIISVAALIVSCLKGG